MFESNVAGFKLELTFAHNVGNPSTIITRLWTWRPG